MEIALIASSCSLLTIIVAISITLLSFKLSNAKDDAKASGIEAARLDGKLAIATAAIATKTNEADSERKRANALDDALGQAEQEMEADPHGALGRLLQRWKAPASSTPAIGAARAMPPPAAPTAPAADRDGLLRPGE